MNWTDNEIKGKILHKLVRFGKFEHSHTAVENLQKGFPKDLTGRAKDMIYELKKEGILKVKGTNYGEQISLNIEMNDRIMYYIEIFLKSDE
ncbi:MAG: hypothetical protein AABX39_00900 [Nanoarchaeota archaeon]